jgi:hypothetical protein
MYEHYAMLWVLAGCYVRDAKTGQVARGGWPHLIWNHSSTSDAMRMHGAINSCENMG